MMVERMLADFANAHGLRYIALRYFNAAGADPEGEIGEDHHPETHLIPLAMQKMPRRASVRISKFMALITTHRMALRFGIISTLRIWLMLM